MNTQGGLFGNVFLISPRYCGPRFLHTMGLLASGNIWRCDAYVWQYSGLQRKIVAAMPDNRKDREISMLRSEIEMLMSERQTLLRVTGAAAVFVAGMDSRSLPRESYASAEMLAEGLNKLPEDTLRDALDLVKGRGAAKDTKT
ncbi:MAG TPA: hypothetical protein VLV32_02245 [Burkholderiales bacterium]|nr:hypothetical protein [Burkholderiales bacterium]